MATLADMIAGFRSWGFTDADINYISQAPNTQDWQLRVNQLYGKYHPGTGDSPVFNVNTGQPSPNSPINATAPTPNQVPGGTPVTGPTPADQSAKAAINATLSQYGLGSLADWAWGEYTQGVPIDQIMLDLRQRPEYQARFPGMDALAKAGHAITEGDYINLENSYASALHAAGLPSGFYDQPADFTGWITGNVSPAEVADRANLAAKAAYSVDATTRGQLEQLYGIDQGSLTAYFLDPNKALPLIENQFTGAQIGASGLRTGFGQITGAQATGLAQQGITADQATQGFGTLAGEKQLFNALPGEASNTISTDQQLAAMFSNNADATNQIEQARARRKAQFAQGGGFGQSNAGVTGIGTANT